MQGNYILEEHMIPTHFYDVLKENKIIWSSDLSRIHNPQPKQTRNAIWAGMEMTLED